MKKSITFFILFFLTFSFVMLAAQTSGETTTDSGIDWVQVIFAGSYLIGVFVLLPIVIFTNMNEKIATPGNGDKFLASLSEEERNKRASEILEKIGEKLTPFQSEEGEDLITITKGSQARFMKHGLDYINQYLNPTDQDVIDRVNEFTEVYNVRAKRAFTGSGWIIACSAGVALLLLVTVGFNTFIVIHLLGLLFYILSSRTTFYGIEKRINLFGGGVGAISAIMGALFLGNGTKYYVKEGNGPWKRDWETEGNMAIITLLILFVVAMFLGFFAVALGVINFIINYSTSFMHPFTKLDKWYEEKFMKIAA